MEREYDQREALYANQIAAADTLRARVGTVGNTRSAPASMSAAILGQAPAAELRLAIERANAIHESMLDICGMLGRNLDRILGERPESSDPSCLAGAIPNSEMGALRTALSDIDAVTRRLHSQVERLEGL